LRSLDGQHVEGAAAKHVAVFDTQHVEAEGTQHVRVFDTEHVGGEAAIKAKPPSTLL